MPGVASGSVPPQRHVKSWPTAFRGPLGGEWKLEKLVWEPDSVTEVWFLSKPPLQPAGQWKANAEQTGQTPVAQKKPSGKQKAAGVHTGHQKTTEKPAARTQNKKVLKKPSGHIQQLHKQ